MKVGRLDQEAYRKLISGQSRGLVAVLLRFLLAIAGGFYAVVVRLRNFSYSKGWLRTHTAKAVVLSIGNITTGGTGKTPLVIWLCKLLREKGVRCAILTRGYKTRSKGRGTRIDEPAILAESCPGAQVIINPDRAAGAAEAVNEFGAQALIMDDGFQHRRLARDLDIVVIDATRPFGYGKMLPAGLLREPVTALKRANSVVITRCDQVSEAELTALERKLKQLNPGVIIARSTHAPVCARSGDNKEIRLEELKGKRIFAFCGIGNPEAFIETVRKLGANVVGSRFYNDHYHYTQDCLSDIQEQASSSNAELILTTQKDWFSSPLLTAKNASDERRATSHEIPFAYLAIELRFVAGEDRITQLIENTLAGTIHTTQRD